MSNESTHARTSAIRPAVLLLGALAGVLLLILWRNAAVGGPHVFADEAFYRLMAATNGEFLPYLRSGVIPALPNHLYFDLFAPVAELGEGSLAAARLLNALLYVSAGIPIFLLGRRMVPANAAVAVAALVLVLPSNEYTAFWIPEATYFTGFWWAALFVARMLEARGGLIDAIAAGIAIAVLSLVKPHGFMVLAAALLASIVLAVANRDERRRLLWLAGYLLLACMAARALYQFLFSGEPAPGAGGGLLGMYAQILQQALAASFDDLRDLGIAAYTNVGSTLLLVGAPLALIGRRLLAQPALGLRDSGATLRLAWLSAIMLAVLIVATVKFTETIAGAGPWESIDRLHQRYYDFTFGLLMLAAWAIALGSPRAAGRNLRGDVFVLGVLFVSGWYWLRGYEVARLSFVDNPFLQALKDADDWSKGAAAMALVAAVPLAARWPRASMAVHTVAFVFVSVAGGFVMAQRLPAGLALGVGDAIGVGMANAVDEAQMDRGLIVTEPGNADVYRVLFHTLSRAPVIVRPAGTPLVDVPADAEWIVTIGSFAAPAGWRCGETLSDNATLCRRVD